MVRDATNSDSWFRGEEGIDSERALGIANRLASLGLLTGGLAHRLNQELVYILFNLDVLGSAVSEMQAFLIRLEPRLQRALGADEAQRLLSRADETGLRTQLHAYASGQRQASAGAGRVRDVVRALQRYLEPEPRDARRADIHRILDHALELVEGELVVRARLSREYGTVRKPPEGDAGLLTQVFVQLLINAVQALPDGHAGEHEVRVRTESRDDTVVVIISHDGEAVPPELRERMFEPFVTSRPDAAGLGLFVARQLVQSVGGTVALVSADPPVVMQVVLPLAEDGVTTEGAEQTVPVSTTEARRRRILVVDDEEMLVTVVRRALQGLLDVVEAHSGEQARALLEKDAEFDLVLCDLHMPEGSGVELYDWAAVTDPDLARRFVIMTAGAFTPATVEFLKRVPNVQIRKPFDVIELRRLIGSLL